MASLSLGHLPVQDEAHLSRLWETAVRALDNVIDLNFYPLPYASLTSRKYRSIGLGVSGYHHMLAKYGISWESEDHLTFVDKVFENINYAAVMASITIVGRKGKLCLILRAATGRQVPILKSGVIHPKDGGRSMLSEKRDAKWVAAGGGTYKQHKYYFRNNSPGVDPVMNKYFLEEKKRQYACAGVSASAFA